MAKVKTSFSLTQEGKDKLAMLASRMGLSQSGVIETLVRERVRRELERFRINKDH